MVTSCIAPAWAKEEQTSYKFSAAEHAAVLNTLRDACRRFSIDTDRVFLSGHSMGGDAAWDIGLAHPDLWAGVIPIVARADKYISRLWENARYLNLYFVGGELDGDNSRPQRQGPRPLHEPRLQRDGGRVPGARARRFFRRDPAAVRLDEPLRTQFLPQGVQVPQHAHLGQLLLVGRARRASPEDDRRSEELAAAAWHAAGKDDSHGQRQQRLERHDRGRQSDVLAVAGHHRLQATGDDHREQHKAKLKNGFVKPDLNVMLEDARTRGDRQHPFWAKVTVPGP